MKLARWRKKTRGSEKEGRLSVWIVGELVCSRGRVERAADGEDEERLGRIPGREYGLAVLNFA